MSLYESFLLLNVFRMLSLSSSGADDCMWVYCSVSVCTGVLVRFGWSRVVSECRLVHCGFVRTQIHCSILHLTALSRLFFITETWEWSRIFKFGSIANFDWSFNAWFILRMTGLLRLMEILIIIIITLLQIGQSVSKIRLAQLTVPLRRFVLGEAPDTRQRSDTDSSTLAATCYQLLRSVAGRLPLFFFLLKFREGRVEIIIGIT